ncbi:DNA-binding protein [Palleronia sp. LCG004]|uniref:DNA-binding protein n=1 Tax=Palleronia sp. LCG004 TaxID=3079304 RepID=UPI0029428F88|nr:DNA-binding protein [Palleronia sp. LCG004]WOI55139.1 DNA-binding protein [Palleronia sp. LCG004]
MNEQQKLTAERFDALTRGPEKLWGLTTIANALGVSVDKTRRLAKRDDVPIYHPPGGGYFATRTELAQWMRTKA